MRVSALDGDGQKVSFGATGWFARIVQHEVDHLDGRPLVDRMLAETFVRREEYLARWRDVPVDEAVRALTGWRHR